MLYGVAIFIFVIVCIMLMAIILLQSSKSGGMGAAMGGQAINTAFGGYGADKLLVKITSGLAVAFMSLAIIIGMMDNPSSRIEFSKDSTLSRNKGNSAVEIAPAVDLLPIEEKVTPVLSAPDESKDGE